MLHAFATDDFLQAVDAFDRHAQQGQQRVGAGNSCGKGACATRQMGPYPPLGSPLAAVAVCRDLWAMADDDAGEPAALMAVFDGPTVRGARHLESLLWRQLQTMHGVDAPRFDWAEAARTDPAQRMFSIGGKPWRIRTLPDVHRPSIVFEPHRG